MAERLGPVDAGPLFLTTARCGDQVLGSPAPRDLAQGWGGSRGLEPCPPGGHCLVALSCLVRGRVCSCLSFGFCQSMFQDLVGMGLPGKAETASHSEALPRAPPAEGLSARNSHRAPAAPSEREPRGVG